MKTIKIIASVLVFTTFVACASENTRPANDTPLRVETYLPVVAQQDGMFVSGMVSAKQTAVISTRMMGFVEKINVRQGQQVKEGQLLMVINSDDLNAKKAQAEAQVAEAQAAATNAARDYERYKALHAKGSVSDKELENMELNHISVSSRLQMAKQGLNEVNAMLAYTNIRAPFAGTVTQKSIDEGSIASPGMPLLVLEQAGELNITASVPENYVSHVRVGDSVTVDIKSLGRQIAGTVSELSSSAALSGGQYGMKVSIGPEAKEQLHAGMYAGIHIPSGVHHAGKKSIWIEQASVVERDQLKGVYVVSPEQRAMLRWVRLGKTAGNRVEVLSGLGADDRIIRLTDSKLYNGKKVSLIN